MISNERFLAPSHWRGFVSGASRGVKPRAQAGCGARHCGDGADAVKGATAGVRSTFRLFCAPRVFTSLSPF